MFFLGVMNDRFFANRLKFIRREDGCQPFQVRVLDLFLKILLLSGLFNVCFDTKNSE